MPTEKGFVFGWFDAPLVWRYPKSTANALGGVDLLGRPLKWMGLPCKRSNQGKTKATGKGLGLTGSDLDSSKLMRGNWAQTTALLTGHLSPSYSRVISPFGSPSQTCSDQYTPISSSIGSGFKSMATGGTGSNRW